MLMKSLLLTCLVSTIIQVVEPATTLECDEEKMIVTFDSANTVDSYNLLDSTTDTANCVPVSWATQIEINLHQCGTTATHNSTHVIYENTLKGESATANALISRGSKLVLKLKCAYAREGKTNVLQWTAGQAVIEVEELGEFTFTLKAYGAYTSGSQTLSSELATPFTIDLRDVIYFEITMDAPTELLLSVNIVHIIAMDNSDIDSTTSNKYYIVEDGCPVDSTYNTVTLTDNANDKGFSFEAFNFASDGTTAVYIHAVVKLCEAGDSSCEDTSCGSKRKRRNTELSGTDSLSQEFHFYGGPYIVREGAVSKGDRGTIAGFLLIFSLLVLGY